MTPYLDTFHAVTADYNSQIKSEYKDKKRGFSILDVMKYSVLVFYVNYETISKLIKKYWIRILDKVLSKYSKNTNLAGEIDYYYDEKIKY